MWFIKTFLKCSLATAERLDPTVEEQTMVDKHDLSFTVNQQL